MFLTREIPVGKFSIGGKQPLCVIAGPCVIESEAHARMIAERLAEMSVAAGLHFIFKASYDKANRTSISSYRGPGMKDGLAILKRIKQALGVPIVTDIHTVEQASPAAEVCDIIQIPAFLCRQTDLVVAAALSGRAINIKKGQFVAPWDMRHAVEKCRDAGNSQVFLTERGASFGYNNLVVDMRSLAIMRKFAPVVFDATHSVQLPSSQSSDGGPATSGGQPEFIPLLARAAVAAGVDGVFMEVHDNPKEAKSDGANALDTRNLRGVLKELLAVQKAIDAAHVTP